MNIPLLYKHREEIYANAEYFYTFLPFEIYGLKKAACIGALLKAFDSGSPFRVVNTTEGKEEFIVFFAGNPMTGSTTTTKTVLTANGTIKIQHSRYGGFLSLVKRLAKACEEYDQPYCESSLTLHDIILKIQQQENG